MKSAVPPFRISIRLLQSWKQGSSHPPRAAIAAAPLYSTLCGGPRPSREAALPRKAARPVPAPGPRPSPPRFLAVVSETKAPTGKAECLYPLRRSWSRHLQNGQRLLLRQPECVRVCEQGGEGVQGVRCVCARLREGLAAAGAGTDSPGGARAAPHTKPLASPLTPTPPTPLSSRPPFPGPFQAL